MRFTSILVAITVILFSRFAFAENVDDLKRNLAIDQRKLVVMENMTLSDEEAGKFWPVFRDFQENLYNLDTQNFRLISFYLKKYKDKSLTDEEATRMIEAYFTTYENRRRLVILLSCLNWKKSFLSKKSFVTCKFNRISTQLSNMRSHKRCHC
jgi:hypothetical protein